MSEQFELNLQPREEKQNYNLLSDANLRNLFLNEIGIPVPSSRDAIIEALTNPTAYLARREEAQNEDKSDLIRTYRSKI